MDCNIEEIARDAQDRRTASDKRAIIVLGTDTPIGLAILRDLGSHGYETVGIGRSERSLGRYSKHCHHYAQGEKDEAALVAQILSLAAAYDAGCLMAISETDLMMLNRHRPELERSVTVLAPPADQLKAVIDKVVCQKHAEAVGIRVPKTIQFTALSEARGVADTLGYPVVLKWSDPHRVLGKLSAAGLPLLKVQYAQSASELLAQLAVYEKAGVYPMVQEYCRGHGLGQMFLMKDGEVVLEFQHERLHEWPPEGGTSTLCRSVPLTEHGRIRECSRALLKRLGWTGVAMVEYRYDPGRDHYCFMEINGRFWGSLPLAIAAGVPFATGLAVACGRNGTMPNVPAPYAEIIGCYWIPETKRLFRLLLQRSALQDLLYRPDPLRSLLTYIALPIRPSTRYFIFSRSDVGPFLADLSGVLNKLWRVLLRR